MPCNDGGPSEYELSLAQRRKVDDLTNMLCGICTRARDQQLTRLINADPTLFAWWKEHQEKDDREKAVEAANTARNRLAASAKRKLSREELEALGLRD